MKEDFKVFREAWFGGKEGGFQCFWLGGRPAGIKRNGFKYPGF